jgi:hypothetical protein
MREEALVQRKRTLCLDCPGQAVQSAAVKVTGLVVHAAHDCVRWVHHAAHHETGASRRKQMERGTLLHIEMAYQPPLREEVCRKLHTGTEACSDHCRNNTSVKTLDAF